MTSLPAPPVALVTGGAKRIGRAIVETLAADGFSVVIHCHRSSAEAASLAEVITARGGRSAIITADLSDAGEVAKVVPAAKGALGPLSLLVNNAAEFEPDAIGSLEPGRWDRHFAINLRAPVFLAQAFAAQVEPRAADACVINIIDQRVLAPRPDYMSYYLSKAGLQTATRTLAQALAPHVRVNAVGPGPTFANARQSQAQFEIEAAGTPLGHGSSGRDVAEAVLYLARARSITGQMVAVDAGQHLTWRE
jgi:NAD(P)-dependent dehydrogenase (short-subunit alcohol dehydrogenase family)